MKILAFTDSHGSLKAIKEIKKKVKKNKVDLIICAGDMTIFGNQIETIIKEISKIKLPTLILHGNHEGIEELRNECKKYKNITFFHKKNIKLKDKEGTINFLGWGGGGFSEYDKSFDKFIKKIKKDIKKNERIVLVTHAPPHCTALDEMLDGCCGNKSIKNFILKEKPILAIAGHIHENNNKKEVINKKTLVINPGPFGTVLKV